MPVNAPERPLLRRHLLAGYVLLIVYASLSPFTGWQEQGLNFIEVMGAPLALTYTAFDAASNGLAYLPLGFLLALNLPARWASLLRLLLSLWAALLLSGGLEYLQLYLPSRTASNVDVLTNGLGALLGAGLALIVAPRTWFARLTERRMALFQRGRGVEFGLALLLLWLLAQINPALPMLGNLFITEAAHRLFAAMPETPFSAWESAAVALNLLLAGLLLQTLLAQRDHAALALLLMLCVVALAKFVAAAVLLKSWALWLWLNSEAMLGIACGLLALWALRRAPRPLLLKLLLLVATAYLGLALLLLDSEAPTAAMRLYHWRYGHLYNYNALSQSVSLLFPLLVLIYLWRVWRRRNT